LINAEALQNRPLQHNLILDGGGGSKKVGIT